MSRVPMGTASAGADTFGPSVAARYPQGLVKQGVAAELVAARWKLDRDSLDAFAVTSHQRASSAVAAGRFAHEIVAMPVAGADGQPYVHTVDETIRPGTTAETLTGLKPSFASPEAAARFPALDWRITPGNSSPLTDGASAALIMSEQMAASCGLRPRARFHAFAVAGDDPLSMLTAPIPATNRVLHRGGLTLDDVDAYEVNEAFACVPLAWAQELGADPARLNPWGGAIALGHALGSSGTRLLATLVNHLEATGGRYGLQTMCEGGGMANATVIERL
jgi:acetyl-CoA acyltransferase